MGGPSAIMRDRIMNGKIFVAASVGLVALAVTATTPAQATFVAAIFNDLACAGGDDIIVTDNGAGDQTLVIGAINFTASAFGYSILMNFSQSKPVIGSAATPQL